MAKKNNNKIAGELSQQSLDYLTLSKQPFAREILSVDSFFNNQALTKITDSLAHQIQFSDLLLLVEGNEGSGKTSLFRQFIQSDIANTKTLSMQAEATDTLVQIQQKMSIHLQDLGDANHLDENLKSLQMFDQTPLVIMDNAHVLSDTTLQELFRYQHQLKAENEINLKILLFANSGMTDTLQKITDIQTDQMYVQIMPELSPKQLDSFITHKLRCAGYFGEPLLQSNDLQPLFKKTNGTPLDIMIQAAPIIDKIVANKIKPPTAGWIKTLIIILILTVIIIGSYITYTYFSNDGAINSPPINTTTIETDKNTNVQAHVTEPVTNYEADRTTVIDVLESDQKDKEKNNKLLDATQNKESLPVNIEAIDDEPIIIKTTETNHIVVEQEVIPETINEPLPEQLPEPLSKPEPEIIKEKTVEQVPEPIQEIVKPLDPALLQLNKMGLQDSNWLSQQNGKNWTLQLIGAREQKTLLKFAQRHNLGSGTAWYKTWLTSKPYYVLVHGSYTTRNKARDAISTLPPTLRSLKPWVKSMKSVQQALK